MDELAADAVLHIWDLGVGLLPYEQALVILRVADRTTEAEGLWSLPIGERDMRLLRIREATFGPTMTARSACRRCGEMAEFELTTTEVIARGRPSADGRPAGAQDGDTVVRVRLPTSRDLARVAALADPEDAALELARGCVEVASRGGEEVPSRSLAAATLAAVAEAVRAADPLAEVLVTVPCPACGEVGETLFDIGSYLWDEIAAEARRLIHEVDLLARAYGWREQDVLTLAPHRRRAYVGLAG
jgi:hypothetical protein